MFDELVLGPLDEKHLQIVVLAKCEHLLVKHFEQQLHLLNHERQAHYIDGEMLFLLSLFNQLDKMLVLIVVLVPKLLDLIGSLREGFPTLELFGEKRLD
jgi:hypothetical protein